MEIGLAVDLDTPILLSKYRDCLEKSKNKKINLCPEGYCTAKEKFKVYPSAYANAYAAQVCKGNKPDNEGNYIKKPINKSASKSNLQRWFDEKWVNVCEKDANGNFKPCGRKKSNLDPKDYPYCRPLHKLEGTTVKTVSELDENQLDKMCKLKRSKQQGVNNKPTRIYIK